jgi:hypothetical protein
MDSRPAVPVLIGQTVLNRGLPYQRLGDIYIEIQQNSLNVSANVNHNPKKYALSHF